MRVEPHARTRTYKHTRGPRVRRSVNSNSRAAVILDGRRGEFRYYEKVVSPLVALSHESVSKTAHEKYKKRKENDTPSWEMLKCS